MMRSKPASYSAITVLMLALGLGACAGDAPVGSVGVALVAHSSDGSLYRLPDDAYLALQGDGFYDELPLGGDAETISAALPPGDYTATLSRPSGSTTEWPLTHELADGTTEAVTGTLVSPQPQTFTIVEGATTGLVLRFEVPHAGTVTFAEGNVNVTVVVDETGARGLALSWTTTVANPTPTTYADTPAVIAAAVPASSDSLNVTITADVTGDWAQAGIATACAPARFNLVDASGQQLMSAIATESFRALTDLCIRTDGGTSYLSATFVQVAAPHTAPFDDPSVDAPQQLFVSNLEADLGAVVFDNGVLDLGALVGNRTAPTDALLRDDGFTTSNTRQRWVRVEGSGSSTLSITATSTPPDLQAPTASFTSVPMSESSSSSATFEFQADEPATFRCSLDGAAMSSCTSPHTVTGLTDGNHSMQVIADDTAGNASDPISYDWFVNTTPPTISVTGPPATTTDTTAVFYISTTGSVTAAVPARRRRLGGVHVAEAVQRPGQRHPQLPGASRGRRGQHGDQRRVPVDRHPVAAECPDSRGRAPGPGLPGARPREQSRRRRWGRRLLARPAVCIVPAHAATDVRGVPRHVDSHPGQL